MTRPRTDREGTPAGRRGDRPAGDPPTALLKLIRLGGGMALASLAGARALADPITSGTAAEPAPASANLFERAQSGADGWRDQLCGDALFAEPASNLAATGT